MRQQTRNFGSNTYRTQSNFTAWTTARWFMPAYIAGVACLSIISIVLRS